MSINSRTKGKRGELELSKHLTRLFGRACRRGQQFSAANGDADVVGIDGLHIEVKRVESLNLSAAMAQSVRDATDAEIPVVCHRKNYEDWLLTVRLEDVPQLVQLLFLAMAGE